MKSQKGANAQKNSSELFNSSPPVAVKERKRYSTEFKKECVRKIDAKETTVSALLHEYEISSASIYRWQELYSPKFQKSVVVVTELASESGRSKRLEAENKDLLVLIGKQAVEIRYWQTLIESAEVHYQIDIKKNCGT